MGTQPKLLITDQDPAMKIAIEHIFPEAMHRFCMWYIMLKVADKIPKSLREDEEFANKLNEIVWSENLEPVEFDHQWDVVLAEYGLTDDTWFKTMFELRKHWIPAYFRDCPLSGLFRTTSISESENSFFRRYLNRQANLIEFFMNFDTAIDAQRNASAQLCSVDESSFPELKTQLMLEKHAASVYTHSIFYDVQEEILAAVNVCCLVNITRESQVTTYHVDGVMSENFKVVHNLSDDSIMCGCKRFIRHGLLCCHVFFVLKNMKLKRIPDKYIMHRWTKFACGKYTESINADKHGHHEGNSYTITQVLSDVYSCIGIVEGNAEHLNSLASDIASLKEKYQSIVGGLSLDKQKLFENFYESSVPDIVSVLPPDVVKTKGSGSRLKSRKEKALLRDERPKRLCRKCNKKCHHDSRNCDRVELPDQV